MTKKWYYTVIVLFFAALFITHSISTSQNSQPQNNNNVVSYEPKILVSDDEKIIIEMVLPPIKIQEDNLQPAVGQLIQLPGYSLTAEPGKPQVPLRGFSLGIPEGARPSLQILEQETGAMEVARLAPAPRIKRTYRTPFDSAQGPGRSPSGAEAFDSAQRPAAAVSEYVHEEDETVYGRSAYWPEAPVTLGEDAIMRGQRIQTVQFMPVSYNPAAQRIRYYKRIKFAVYYNAPAGLQKTILAPQDIAPAFEGIYKSTLLNYEAAKNWRIPRQNLQKAAADNYFLSQGSEWYKILLEKPGIYYLEKADLVNAGLNVSSIDPRRLRMFNKGVEIAIRVEGEEDGRFDEGDYLEFYGTAFKNYYTTTNMYWLTVGSVNGKRMEVRDGRIVGNPPTLIRGKEKIHYEKDKTRRADYPGHTDANRWWWKGVTAPEIETETVVLTAVSDTIASDCRLWLKGQGMTETAENPDHHIQVELNSHRLMEEFFNGRIPFSCLTDFPQSFLSDGTNIFKLVGPGDTGASIDYVYFDFFEIEYWKDYRAQNDSLYFTASFSGICQLKLGNFSVEREICIFDISDSTDVINVLNFYRENDVIRFQANVDDFCCYIAVSKQARRKPISVFRDSNSNLRATNNSAKYIIITHENFNDEADRLAEYRSHTMQAKVVEVQNVYDEFNYGYYDAKPIKDFLSFAYNNWSSGSVLDHAILLGDASWNPQKNNPGFYGNEDSDFMPTRLFEAIEDNFEAASDNWFGCVAGNDVIPDILVGRLPARSAEQAKAMVDKLINYETGYQAGAWNNTATFCADNGEGGVLAFEDTSDAFVRDLVPAGMSAEKIYLSKLGTTNARNATKAAFNDGTLIMNFYGHGSSFAWAAEGFFMRTDVPNLRNDNFLPYVSTLSCINGYFVNPKDADHALAEALIRERQRGAVAVFSGSGEAYPSPVLVMGRNIYKSLFQDHNTTVGSFSTAGLVAMYSRYPNLKDHVMFYVLFGDPATELHYELAVNFASAGFDGQVTINGKPVEDGKALIATIQKKMVATTHTNNGGRFGPIYVPADNPETAFKEGGVAGDKVCFKIVQATNDTTALYPFVLWKAGETQTVALTDVVPADFGELIVDFYVDEKKAGLDFFAGDPIAAGSVITAEISATTGPLDPSSFEVELNGEPLDKSLYSLEPTADATNGALYLVYQPQVLANGSYELVVRPRESGPAAPASLDFFIQSTLSLVNVLNYPNPVPDEARFMFMLQNDRPAEVQIKIYTVAGRLVRIIDAGYVSVGYFESETWDSTDESGDRLANGTYLYKVIADDGEEKTEVVEKLVVMR